MEPNMKTLKALMENVRAYNLDTDEELDLDDLVDIDLDALLGGEYIDNDGGDVVSGLDFSEEGGEDLDIWDIDLNDDGDDLSWLGGDEEPASEFDLGSDDLESGDTLKLDTEDSGEFGDLDLNADEELPFGDEEFLGDEALGGEGEGDEFAGEEDANFQGEIRTVRGANLVYKRKTSDGNFEELWIYNIGKDIKRETQIRRAILAGTDIDPGAQESQDGSQRAETSTAGNVQFLHIVGLPQ